MDVKKKPPAEMLAESIKGIGETTARALVAQGYDTIDAVAAATPQALEAKLRVAGVNMSSARIEQYDWIGQARAILDQHPEDADFKTHASFELAFQAATRPDGTTAWRIHLRRVDDASDQDELDVSASSWVPWIVEHAELPLAPGVVIDRPEFNGEESVGRVGITGYDVRMNEGRATMDLGFGVGIEPGAVARSWSLEVTCRDRASGRRLWRLSTSGDRLETEHVALHEVQVPSPGSYDLDAVFLVDLSTGPEIAYRRLRLNAQPEEAVPTPKA